MADSVDQDVGRLAGSFRPGPLALTGLLIGLCLLAALARGVHAKDQAAPDAAQVVVRGQTVLVDALAAALHPLLAETPTRPVCLIVDGSPNVLAKRDVLCEALRALDGRYPHVPDWRIARLGEAAGAGVESPSGLVDAVEAWGQDETSVVSTLEALARTLKRSKCKGSAVLYINDWRFEDDARLEDFLKKLRRAQNGLSVVGTEAGFGRAWNDGWVSPSERFNTSDPSGPQIRDYYEGVGRSPFVKGEHEAPWHGGDTAYPHAPYRWNTILWKFEFAEFDFTLAAAQDVLDLGEIGGAPEGFPGLPGEEDEAPDFEDLKRRLKNGGGVEDDKPVPFGEMPSAEASRLFPIPAAYGPYGLMRCAGETGGRYVLWSWNPGGRRQVHYDYGRCNLFPPDLRPRKQILSSLRKTPYAAAMIQAWCALEAAGAGALDHSAPLKAAGSGPRSIDRLDSRPGSYLALTWETRAVWSEFRDAAKEALAALETAGAALDKVLQKEPPEGETPVVRRYRADAELFRHVVRVVHLEVAEGLRASASLPKDAWARGDTIPGVIGLTWISRGLDPDTMRITKPAPSDAEAARVVQEERKRLLTHYRGTPFAEIVGLNDVEPLHLVWWQRGGTMPDIGRSPTESTGRPTPGSPGAPSSGGGPSTGK